MEQFGWIALPISSLPHGQEVEAMKSFVMQVVSAPQRGGVTQTSLWMSGFTRGKLQLPVPSSSCEPRRWGDTENQTFVLIAFTKRPCLCDSVRAAS